MTPLQRILILLMATALLWLTFELLRKRRLREEYAVLWVCTGLMLLAFAAFPRTLFIVAAWVGLDHTVLMLLACFLFSHEHRDALFRGDQPPLGPRERPGPGSGLPAARTGRTPHGGEVVAAAGGGARAGTGSMRAIAGAAQTVAGPPAQQVTRPEDLDALDHACGR